MTKQEIDKAADLWEAGCEMNDQLQSELNHTYWELDGKYGIADQCRELNQVSIELAVLKGDLHHG